MQQGFHTADKTILVVDDDRDHHEAVQRLLERENYKVISALNGREMKEKLETAQPALVLLDLMLPEEDGFALLSALREKSSAPVILISGRQDMTYKVVGLEMGATDYITKPFEPAELTARIKAVLRRSQQERARGVAGSVSKISFNGWTLDRRQYRLFNPTNDPVDLTTGEFRVLEALVMAAKRVLSREFLFELTRSGASFAVESRSIDAQIARIRRKLGDNCKSPTIIKTVRGMGYTFCGDAAVSE